MTIFRCLTILIALQMVACGRERTDTLQKVSLFAPSEGGTLTFHIPAGAEEVLVQPFPVAAPGRTSITEIMQRRRLPFTFRYQIIEGKSTHPSLIDRNFAGQAQCIPPGLSHLADAGADAPVAACESSPLLIPLLDAPRKDLSVRLSVSKSAMNAPLQGIYFTVHYKLPASNYRANFLWQRLSPSEKAQLTQDLYLTEGEMKRSEKSALVQNPYKPLAPEGRSPVDFRENHLYRMPASAPNLPFTAFEIVGPHAEVELPIDLPEAEVLLQVSPLISTGGSNPSEVPFRLCWQTADQSREEACKVEQSFTSKDFEREQKLRFRAGRILIKADRPLIVKARYRLPQAAAEETSQLFTLKSAVLAYEAFKLAAEQIVEVALPYRGKEEKTPLKLTFWVPVLEGEKGPQVEAVKIHIRRLGAQGQNLGERDEKLEPVLSAFDRPSGRAGFTLLSKPISLYLQASGPDERIQITTPRSLYLFASTRREAMPAYYKISPTGTPTADQEKPSWVPTPVVPFDTKLNPLPSDLIYSYPDQDEALLASRNQRYVSFAAMNENRGTFGLIPIDDAESPAADRAAWKALHRPYYEISRQPLSFALTPLALSEGIKVSVFNERGQTADLSLSIDGERLALPAAPPGMSEFKLDLPPRLLQKKVTGLATIVKVAAESASLPSLKIFMAHLDPQNETRTPYLKRYLYRSGADPLEFALTKKSRFQLLSLMLIVKNKLARGTVVDFSLNFKRKSGASPFCCQSAWTVNNRLYQIDRASQGSWAYLFSGERALVYKISLLLKDDVMEGPLIGSIGIEGGDDALALVSGTVPEESQVLSSSMLMTTHSETAF